MVQWLAAFVGQSRDLIEQLLWGGLLGGLVCATIHLLTMLVTRWGDRGPTSKSLLFSILVHISCAFGLIAVAPPKLQSERPKREKRIELRQLFVEGEEDVHLKQTGKTPVWERLPETPNQQLTRIERFPLAVAPLKINDRTAEAPSDLRPPSMSVAHRQLRKSGLHQTPLDRSPKPVAVGRLREDLGPTRALAWIPSPPNTNAILKQGNDMNRIRRRSGTASAIASIDESRSTVKKTSEGSAAGSSGPLQFTRQRIRTVPSRNNGGLKPPRPKRAPQIPISIPDRVMAIRESLNSDLPNDGLNPNVRQPNLDTIRSRNTTNIPATYRLRNLARRKEISRKYGGTNASERAVESSLRWLVLHQNVEGFWSAHKFLSHCPDEDRCRGRAGRQLHGSEKMSKTQRWAGLKADTGLTALAILAFLGAGYTHEEGQYADHVDRALNWLVRQQHSNGFLGGHATHYARMYCHAMATYVIAEAYGMQSDPTTDTRLREPLARAVAYIIENQNPQDGGWRYQNWMSSDMSMFGWQLMALKSAEITGIPIPTETKNKMIQFLKTRSLGKHKGLAAYRIVDPPLPSSASMTAEALFCKQMLGIKRTNPASEEAVTFLMQRLPKRSEQNLYYWYYGTLAIYQYGGQPWQQWNESLRDELVQDQRQTGHATGSWDPKPPWGPHGGRIYSTALSTLCLEVYYRFLPLYQMGGKYSEE